ncbi:MAG: hypothetical protein HY847_11015 [Betaproteobacteria bacterium]|nr:hypothetical protein [Betaproteobacteria bacterium]
MNVQASHSPPLLILDTTSGSVLHKLFTYIRRSAIGRTFPRFTLFIASIALAFIPLLVAAIWGPLSLTESTPTHQLPFLYDWNVLFMFLVSFPSLVICIANDQHILLTSLNSVESDGTLTIAKTDASQLVVLWQKRFRKINWIGQALGLIAGGVLAYFNYVAYTPPSVGYWIAENGNLLPVGFVLLYCVFLFYFLVPILILRIIFIAVLLRDIVAHSTLRILPLHPDKSGGLRSMGTLGLRNQYLLTIFGLNIVLMAAIPFHYLQAPITLYGLTATAVIGYLILGPVIFLAPLIPFRNGMLSFKNNLMVAVAQRLHIELERLRTQMKSEAITEKDADLIERLQKIASAIDQLPVWPFDAATMRKFVVAYAVPLFSGPIPKAIFEAVKPHF